MSSESLINYISRIIDVTEKEAIQLTHFFKDITFSKGSIIEKQNVIAQKLYFIKKGILRTFFNEDGLEVTTQIVTENNFITAFNSFVLGVVSEENIQCISDCEMIYISKPDYETLTRESAIWSMFCKKVYEKAISFNHYRMTDLLTLPAEKRYLKLLKEQPEIIQNVPIQYIASYIGIKPETLSRIRKKIFS